MPRVSAKSWICSKTRASYDVKEGDIIEINIGAKPLKVRVLDVKEFTKKEDAAALYEVVQ